MPHTLKLNNEETIPMLGLGTWKSEPGEVYQAVVWAIETGYRHIDCAPIYGNEKEVGKAIQDCIQKGLVKREDLFITTKLWNNAHGSESVLPALRASLNDLKLEYLDLFLIHWAVAQRPEAIFPEKPEDLVSLDVYPLHKTWYEMEKSVNQGLAKSIGVSNFGPKNLEIVLSEAAIKPVMNQVEAHPYLQQDSLISYCNQHQIALTAYSPLGSKDRPDFLKADDEPSLFENETIKSIANKHAVSTAEVLIAWAIQRGTVVIPKSVNKQRIATNFAATSLLLEEKDMQRIKKINIDRRYVDGTLWAMPGSPYTVESVYQ